jgi:hypothetical protein
MQEKNFPVFFIKAANKLLISPRKNGYQRDEKLKKILSIKNSIQDNNWRKYHVEEAFVLNIFNIFLEIFLYRFIIENFHHCQNCIYQG